MNPGGDGGQWWRVALETVARWEDALQTRREGIMRREGWDEQGESED
jgi:hypothetical protein